MTKLKALVRRSPVLLAVLPLMIVAACIAGVREMKNDTGRQGWWEDRGPVVPHDGFPGDCTLCHDGDDWHTLREDFQFDHLGETGVPLNGAHGAAECLRCHNDRGPVQAFASRGCSGCHEDFHMGKLGSNCSDCHEELDWRVKEVIAIHDRTRFPLVGSHASAQCWRCHEGARDGVFTNASSACEVCHQDDLARADMPDHLGQGFTTNCDDCHIPTTWGGAAFNHPAFRLAGAHAAADCASCHAGNVFAGTPSDCFVCHGTEYMATTDPAHAAAGFSTDCAACHGDVSWQGALFTHQSFPLTGAHVAADCTGCHAGNVFAGTPTDCYSCHMSEYQTTTSPGHLAAGFPTDCMLCHTTNAWLGATFSHTTYPLTGAHVSTDCSACHTNGVYQGTPTDCFACHGADYNATSMPNHLMAGFPTDCMACHNTTAWEGAVFNHDFPITSGDHANFDCIDCHMVPQDFSVFSCTNCHEHNKTDMDKEHKGVGGYVYLSSACYACHPDGKD